MKKITTVITVLCLLTLAGCSSRRREPMIFLPEIDPATTAPTTIQEIPTTEPTQVTTAPTVEITTPLVDDAFSQSLRYMAPRYDPDTQSSYEVETVVEYHIPQIHLPGQTVSQINAEIYEEFHKFVDYSIDEIALNGWPVSCGINYEWSVHTDILSVMIYNDMSSECGSTQYATYNISVSTGEVVEKDAVIAAAGLSPEQFPELAKTALKWDFETGYDLSEEMYDYYQEFLNEQLEKTIADENINDIRLYLNEQAQLCIIWRAYSIAGADYYWHTMNLTEFLASGQIIQQ